VDNSYLGYQATLYYCSLCSVLTELIEQSILASMDKKQQFIEEVGLYFERVGLTRMEGRVIGWLLICDPPYQSMIDLVEVLGASKSSISVALRTLVTLYLIEQVSIPGERRDYYKASSDMWNRAFRARMHQVTELRLLAERGIELLTDELPEQKRRLELMRDHNAFMEAEFPKLLDQWDEIKKAKGYDTL
jgi:DNA-binding transcriptional regulator GbsR (MarR family)